MVQEVFEVFTETNIRDRDSTETVFTNTREKRSNTRKAFEHHFARWKKTVQISKVVYYKLLQCILAF